MNKATPHVSRPALTRSPAGRAGRCGRAAAAAAGGGAAQHVRFIARPRLRFRPCCAAGCGAAPWQRPAPRADSPARRAPLHNAAPRRLPRLAARLGFRGRRLVRRPRRPRGRCRCCLLTWLRPRLPSLLPRLSRLRSPLPRRKLSPLPRLHRLPLWHLQPRPRRQRRRARACRPRFLRSRLRPSRFARRALNWTLPARLATPRHRRLAWWCRLASPLLLPRRLRRPRRPHARQLRRSLRPRLLPRLLPRLRRTRL